MVGRRGSPSTTNRLPHAGLVREGSTRRPASEAQAFGSAPRSHRGENQTSYVSCVMALDAQGAWTSGC